MGLNIGSLGYLTSVEESLFGEALQQLREDRCAVSRRSALAVRVLHGDGRIVALPDALNDVVANHGTTAHAVELELSLDEKRWRVFFATASSWPRPREARRIRYRREDPFSCPTFMR
jgi:NAD kinase